VLFVARGATTVKLSIRIAFAGTSYNPADNVIIKQHRDSWWDEKIMADLCQLCC